METKNLEIQQAVGGEKFNKTLYTFDEFKTELAINNISDIFSNNIKIKQDKQKYIFSIDETNKFAIDGDKNVVNWIQRFYTEQGENEKRKAEEKVLIRIQGLKLEYIKSKTQDELDVLKKDISKTDKSIEKATDIENVKYHIERNIAVLEQEKKLTEDIKKTDRIDKQMRKAHKAQIQERLDRVYRMKSEVELLAKNKSKKYAEVKMDDVNGMDSKLTLTQISERLYKIEEDIPNFIRTRNEIINKESDTTPYYEVIINDRADAKKVNKALMKINKEYAILDELKLTGAKRQELSQDLQALEEYLNNVINNPNTFKPSEHPFVPTHTKDFYELTKIDPSIFGKLNKEADTKTEEKKETATTTTTGTTGKETIKTGTESKPSTYSSAKESFEKGGIGGIIKYGLDKSNMKPEQKQFWGGVSNLAVTGGMLFIGWKMLSSAYKIIFKSKKGDKDTPGTGIYDVSNLARLGIPAGLMFGANARKGEGLGKLLTGGEMTKSFANIFGGGSTAETANQTPQEQETRTKYKEGVPGVTALFSGLNYGEMKQFLIEDGNQIKIDPNKYDALLDMFKNGSKKNEAAAAFLESMGKDDERHVVDLGLTGMGISRKQIDNESDKNKTFDKQAIDSIAKISSVVAFMDTNKYNKINSETQYLVDEYIAHGKDVDDLKALEARGDVFYKDITVSDKTGLGPQIKELANNDKEKEEELLLAMDSFYDQMPNAEKKIEISGKRPEIEFKTYEQTTLIDLKKKELKGFTPNRFSSYLETFKAANLTNRIKFICKDKEAKIDKPFYLSPGRDITFDNANIFSTDFDTEIITAGWFGALQKVSPTLENNKQAYCDYLNESKFWKNSGAVNTTEKTTFDKDTQILTIGNKQVKITIKEKIGNQRVNKDFGENVLKNMDENRKKELIKSIEAIKIGDKATTIIQTDGKEIETTINRIV